MADSTLAEPRVTATPPPSRLRGSLRASVADGACHAAMIGFGEVYLPAFGLFLGASAFQVGLLTTLPMLGAAVAQLAAPRLAYTVGARGFVVGAAVVQALCFVPISALALGGGDRYPPLLAGVTLYWLLALGINPVWSAWMGRMMPAHLRGRFFGRRNAAINAALLASTLVGGTLLETSARGAGSAALGFVATFALAAVCRLAGAWFLSRQHDPMIGQPPRRPPLVGTLRTLANRPAGRVIALLILVMGAVNLSAPYFTPYMLRRLRLSYAEFTILSATVLLARILASAYWGRVATRIGNRRVLQVSGTLLVPLAALWVVSDAFVYLIGLQLLAGFAWAGFELATILTLFDATDDTDRAQVLSLYTLLNGVAIVVASVLGGLVLRGLGEGSYHGLFLASTALRAATMLLVARGVGGRRPGEPSFGSAFAQVLVPFACRRPAGGR